MKRLFLLIAFVFLSVNVFSKNIDLKPTILDNGAIEIENVKGKVEDRINVENLTDEKLEIVIYGIEKKGKSTLISSTSVFAHEKRYISTAKEDDLDDFVKFRVEVKGAKVEFCTAQCEWSDLYLVISQVKTDASADYCEKPYSEADELLKWKQLLDSGAITKDEYEAKKKQILAL